MAEMLIFFTTCVGEISPLAGDLIRHNINGGDDYSPNQRVSDNYQFYN